MGIRRRVTAGTMYPDNAWENYEREPMLPDWPLDDWAGPKLSDTERDVKAFEKAFNGFLLIPQVQEMDLVTALQTFLERYPEWRIPRETKWMPEL